MCLLQVLTTDLEFVRHIENEGLAGRSCTGIAVSNNGLVVVNWRTKTVTELSPIHGDTLFKFSHNAFQVKRLAGHLITDVLTHFWPCHFRHFNTNVCSLL